MKRIFEIEFKKTPKIQNQETKDALQEVLSKVEDYLNRLFPEYDEDEFIPLLEFAAERIDEELN